MVISVGAWISLLIALVIIGVVVWLVDYVVRTLPVPDPIGRIIRMVAMVLGVLIAVLLVLQTLGLVAPGTVTLPAT